ncbi:hypothetical protein SAMN05519104_3703 [Rhizobiales bacterium GAS188]|nr:hypothetical protein SAMN05519104_3703 [Rhizobiales bacterium GAS188]
MEWASRNWSEQDANGVRFRLFPKPPFLHPGHPPETVHVSGRPGSIGPGPSDDHMYLINPVGKSYDYGLNRTPYGTIFLNLPPWRGEIRRPVRPGADGHFDHIPIDAPEFAEAHIFGSVRFTLDIWERYFGHSIDWHFAKDFQRLEIAMLPAFDNSHVGYGFMEIGAQHRGDGAIMPYSLNFDVMAHELGHLVIYGTVGVPNRVAENGEYFGWQESAADLSAMVASLHFQQHLSHLLEETHGNFYTFNELDRFAELDTNTQIRLANNSLTLADFADGWHDEHKLSQPMTGAVFDILVDVFQEALVERGLISRAAADRARGVEHDPSSAPRVQALFDEAYQGRSGEFREALIEARDYLGAIFAAAVERLSPDHLNYAIIADAMLDADRALTGGRYRRLMLESFDWRGIGRVKVGPRLSPPDDKNHTHSDRTLLPQFTGQLPKLSFRERMIFACACRNA